MFKKNKTKEKKTKSFAWWLIIAFTFLIIGIVFACLGLSVDSKATTIKNTTYFIAMVISFVLFITSLVLAVVFERIYEKILDKHELTQPTVPSATVTSV